MPYRVDVRDGGDDLVERLIDLGAIDVERTTDGVAALMPDGMTPAELSQLLHCHHLTVSPAIGRDADSTWVLQVPPLRAGGVDIVPAGSATPADAVQLVDGVAFGTGLHPTTALCLDAIAELVRVERPGTMLDVGTGSGVIALAALRLGVDRALGIDIDAAAIGIAANNARVNRLADRLELRRGHPETAHGTWPLVVANVLAASLIEMAPTLARCVGRGGHLVLSGIPSSLEGDVITAYRRLGLRHIATTSRAGWVAIVLRPGW